MLDTTDTPTTVHEVVPVRFTGQSSLEPATKTLDVHATVLEQKLHVVYEEQEITTLNFGPLYHGKQLKKTVYLLNDGPTPLGYTCILGPEAESDGRGGA